MKLDESDYLNIFLRVREKLLTYLVAILATFFAIFGITSWYVAKQRIDSITEAAVNKYVQSDAFQRKVASAYNEKLSHLEKRTSEMSKVIDDQERLAANLSAAPVLIDDNGLIITNKTGEKFIIEMGNAQNGSKITFKNHYKKTPFVILYPDGEALLSGMDINRLSRKIGVTPVVSASIHGFEIPSDELSMYVKKYRWIAFGR